MQGTMSIPLSTTPSDLDWEKVRAHTHTCGTFILTLSIIFDEHVSWRKTKFLTSLLMMMSMFNSKMRPSTCCCIELPNLKGSPFQSLPAVPLIFFFLQSQWYLFFERKRKYAWYNCLHENHVLKLSLAKFLLPTPPQSKLVPTPRRLTQSAFFFPLFSLFRVD